MDDGILKYRNPGKQVFRRGNEEIEIVKPEVGCVIKFRHHTAVYPMYYVVIKIGHQKCGKNNGCVNEIIISNVVILADEYVCHGKEKLRFGLSNRGNWFADLGKKSEYKWILFPNNKKAIEENFKRK